MQGDTLSELPPKVVTAFEGRAWLDFAELCEALDMPVMTMRRHIEAGNIEWRQKGIGKRNIKRVFSIFDVAAFWQLIKHKGLE